MRTRFWSVVGCVFVGAGTAGACTVATDDDQCEECAQCEACEDCETGGTLTDPGEKDLVDQGGAAGAADEEPAEGGAGGAVAGGAGGAEPAEGGAGGAVIGGAGGAVVGGAGDVEPEEGGAGGAETPPVCDPGPYEICDNQADDDCDGEVNEAPCRDEEDLCGYDGSTLPSEAGWDVLVGPSNEDDPSMVEVEDGRLHLTDTESTSLSRIIWGKECFGEIDSEYTYVAEFDVQVAFATQFGGFLLGVGTETNVAEISLTEVDVLAGSDDCEGTHYSDLDLASDVVTIRLELTREGTAPALVTTYLDDEQLDQREICSDEYDADVIFGLGSDLEDQAEGTIDEIRVWREKR